MSDGPTVPTLDDYKDDCLRHRVPPGDGEFDVDGFVAAVLDAGYAGPWDLEVCNDDVWNTPPDAHLARAHGRDAQRSGTSPAHAHDRK